MLNPQDPSSPGKLRLVEAMNVAAPAVWDWDLKTGTFVVSNRIYEIYGFARQGSLSVEEFLGATHSLDLGWANGLLERAADLRQGRTYRYRIRRNDTGEMRWIKAQVIATYRPDDPQTAVAYTGTVEDVTEQTRATHALMESEMRLRLAIEAGKMAVWEVDLEAGSITNSPELNLLFGLPADAKPSFQELRSLYAPGEVARLAKEGATLEVVRERYAQGDMRPKQESSSNPGEDRTQVQAELTIITPGGIAKRLLYRAQYAFSLEGRPQITGLLVDITERKLAEERLAIVARELHHRVKNSLAVVQTIAVQSFRSSTDMQAAVRAFLDRLQALATATDIILHNSSSDADIHDIVDNITKPYRLAGVNTFTIKGSNMRVPGKVATALGMVLHELCTNALKYGALSVASGRVALEWKLIGDGRLFIDWRETNGPMVDLSPTKGFGTKLLEALVAGDLAGSLDLRFEPTGILCHITTGPLSVLRTV